MESGFDAFMFGQMFQKCSKNQPKMGIRIDMLWYNCYDITNSVRRHAVRHVSAQFNAKW